MAALTFLVALFLTIPLLQCVGYWFLSRKQVKKASLIVIGSTIIAELTLLPVVLRFLLYPNANTWTDPPPSLEYLVCTLFGIVPSLLIHLIYLVF